MKELIDDLNLESIIKEAISPTLSEAVVAQPKIFVQATDKASQKTKDAHYRLYEGYAKSLTEVSSKLDSVKKDTANPRHSDFRSLKLDETYNHNATWLHELYFANCFDPTSEVYTDTLSYMRLNRDWGSFDDWQRDFMACALASGEGWAVCGYSMFLKRYVNTLVSHHSGDVMLGLFPVIVVDMWSHAYYRDYVDDKQSYLINRMRELNWTVIEERFGKAERIAEATK